MDSTTTSTVSYRPYKSKRHSRTISGEVATSSHVSADPATYDDRPRPSPNGIAPRSRPASVALTNGHVAATPSAALASQLMLQSDPVAPSPSPPQSSNGPPTPPSSSSKALTPAPPSLTLTPPSSRSPTPTPSFSKAPALAPTASSSKTPTPTTIPGQPKPPTSTLRRLAAPSQSSPLRPTPTSTPAHVARRRHFDTQPESQSQPQPPPTSTPTSSRTSSPTIPTIALSSPTPRPSAAGASPSQTTHTASDPRISHSSTPTPTTAPTTAPSSTASTPSSRRSSAPYRPGFQPKGVYRPLTDEFLAARTAVRDRDKVERHRLERRLEKLIALHFPREPSAEKPKSQVAWRSSLLEFNKNPAELWRDVMQRPKTDIRAEEQSITPWQEDSAVSRCPLCSASFHPLTNRKHHCRLCGRIVCARIAAQTCSLLFVVDQKSGAIEEVGEGVDYGVRRKGEEEKFLSGVRVCRECRVVLLRQQYLQEAEEVLPYVRLYSTLIIQEREIEDFLSQFQELILSLTAESPSAVHASAAALRTQVLASFAEYDRLAKRIRDLPVARGSAQGRVQSAIATRANIFLQRNMCTLQALPKQGTKDKEEQGELQPKVDKDSVLAHALQPLLEQEALLETFVEEARTQRKFEDAKTLKANLEEIRAEIERMSKGGGVGVGVGLRVEG